MSVNPGSAMTAAPYGPPGGAPARLAAAMSALMSRGIVGLMTISSITVRAGSVTHRRIARATSSACIIVARAFASGGSGRFSRIGVSTSAGMIVVARIPLSRSSVWMWDIRFRTAALAAPYGAPPMSPGRSAATDDTVTIVPPPRSSMLGSTAWVSAQTPFRLTSSTLSHSSLLTQRIERVLLEWPALLTRTSTRPSVASVQWASAAAAPCLETSACRAVAFPPALWSSPTTSSSGGLRRPATTTCAPSAASSLAVSRPMPLPPPVTMATCPSSLAITPANGPPRSVRRQLPGPDAGLSHGGDLLGGLGGQEAAVAGERDELVARGDHLQRVGRGRVVDARDDAVALARLDDSLLGFHDGRVGLVEARLAAERQRQVRGADIDRINTGDRQDRVDVLHGLGRLDHRHDDQVVVGVVAVVAARVDRRPHGTPAPVAAGRVLARGNQRLRLGPRVDHRADDAVDARVEDLHDARRIVPGDARQRDHRGRRDRLEHRDGHLVVDDAVLHVHGEGVEPLVGHDLSGERARNRQPPVHDRLAPRPDRLQRVLPHVTLLPLGRRARDGTPPGNCTSDRFADPRSSRSRRRPRRSPPGPRGRPSSTGSRGGAARGPPRAARHSSGQA